MNTNATTEYVQADEDSYPSTVWKFTQLDRACFSMVIRGTWIFDVQLDIDILKAGLKKLLCYYPHLSGRMKDDTGIHLTNEGIPFTVAYEPELIVADVYKKSCPIKKLSTELKIPRIKSGIDAPLSVKITRLKNGSVLGMQCFHACMDGYSFYTLVHNWGQISRKKDFEKPVLDQSLIPMPENLSRDQALQLAIESGWEKTSTWTFLKLLPLFISGVLSERTDAFYFSADGLNGLKQKISDSLGFPCSTNVALSAFLSKMCMKLYSNIQETKCTQVTVTNSRLHLAGIPRTFVGNSSAPVLTPPFLGSASVDDIARIIYDTLAPMLKIPSPELKKDIIVALSVLPHRLPVAPVNILEMFSKKPTVFQINNFSKLPIYDVDFGLGKPANVIPHNLSDPILIWPAHPLKGGVEVYFSGVFARTIGKLKEEDSWLREIKQYC